MTARARLTLLSTALVLGSGVALSALTYLLMRGNRRVVQVIHSADGGPLPPVEDIGRQIRAATLADLLTRASIALVVVTALAAILGWLVSGRLLRPIREISATAQRSSAENLSERVPVTTPTDEVTALADTVNVMLDRIQRGVAERDQVLDSQRLFTASAAHELRTPLTTMRTAVDVTLDGDPTRAELVTMAEDIRTAITRSQRTLDGLLALAHSQAGPGDMHALDLATIVSGCAAPVAVQTDLEPAPVLGDPVLLERMIANLVDNAVRHNRPGGDIAVATGTAAGQAFLRIANSGRTISPDEADRLLEPFVRTRTEDGSGLGLSIVRAIVAVHRGELTLSPRAAGGLEITVRLPIAGC
ncbi:HAMP domain-containing histidine kinase [Kribbella antibiotica]|uniref:histidine kinase n=1 Tax=Kribbella antibiotica TaxID=190195 RepID=A0A4R4YYD9_9ACTN|nr:HAMP domain-containing histidine kinase [Kribbella antibiotica]